MNTNHEVIEISQLKTCFGNSVIHKNINLKIKAGETIAIVGGSGSGKTTLLREMLALTQPTAGLLRILDCDLSKANSKQLLNIQRRCGVLFQQNALFSSLTLLENVCFPLQEHTTLDKKTLKAIAILKIAMAGLPIDAANKYPAELSGGMQKRAGLARAIALDPELLFLDEPTAGLDPTTAAAFDQLIIDLQQTMGLTIVMVTHDLDSLWTITDRVAFLGEGVVLDVAPITELVKNPHPEIQAFFNGPRGLIAQKGYEDVQQS